MNVDEEVDKDDFIIHSPLAEEESLFTVAPDMWAVVGWGFNCSVAHKKRWQVYRNVLDLFLRALEEDLDQRVARWKEEKVEKNKGSHLDGALLLKMLPTGRNTSDIRRVVKSIFADGGKNEFGALWEDELKRRRTKKQGKKEIGRTIADDEGITDSEAEGSGLSDDDDGGAKGKDVEVDVVMGGQAQETTVNAVEKWGGVEAVEMRQRFLVLVSIPLLSLVITPTNFLPSSYPPSATTPTNLLTSSTSIKNTATLYATSQSPPLLSLCPPISPPPSPTAPYSQLKSSTPSSPPNPHIYRYRISI